MAHEGEVDEEVQEREETVQPQELTPAREWGGWSTRLTGLQVRSPTVLLYPHHAISIPRHPSHHDSVPRLTPTTTGLSMDQIQGGTKLLVGIFSPDPQRDFLTTTPHSTHGERKDRAVANLPKGTGRGTTDAHPTPHRCPVG